MKKRDEQHIADLEASASKHGHPLAPRGECSSCDAYRGIMWPDRFVAGRRVALASCAGCRDLWPMMREVEDLVAGWDKYQQAVADAGGWTPKMLRAHSKALHPEEKKAT